MEPLFNHPDVSGDAVSIFAAELPLGKVLFLLGHHWVAGANGEVVHLLYFYLVPTLDGVLQARHLPSCLEGQFAESAHFGLDAGQHE